VEADALLKRPVLAAAVLPPLYNADMNPKTLEAVYEDGVADG